MRATPTGRKTNLQGRLFEQQVGSTEIEYELFGSLSTDRRALIVEYWDENNCPWTMKLTRSSQRSTKWSGSRYTYAYEPCLKVTAETKGSRDLMGISIEGAWVQLAEKRPSDADLKAMIRLELWAQGREDPFVTIVRSLKSKKRQPKNAKKHARAKIARSTKPTQR